MASCYRSARSKPRCAHLTAWTRASNIAGMSEGAPAALKKPGAGLVEMERELEALLVEYESLSRAWPEEPDVVARAGIGRQVENTLARIAGLQHVIATTPARTVPEAGVHLRRLAALFEGWGDPLRRLLMSGDNDDGQTARCLLASALAAVEAADVPHIAPR